MPRSFEQGPGTPSRFSLRQSIRSRRRRPNPNESRLLLLEMLESRQLLDGSWQNPFNPRDITGDGVVVPQDILVAINELNNRQFIDSEGRLPDRSQFPTAPFYDFTGDGKLVPLDVLPIINRYNADEVSPTIVVGLTQDTAPGGTNTDLLTRDPRLSGRITDDTGVSRLAIKVDDGPDRIVTVAPDGTFQFDPSLAPGGIEDGEHEIQVVATDGRRNVSAPVEFSFQLDTVGLEAPTSLDLDSDSDTGSSATDRITNDDTPTIHGDAVPGSVIQILSGSQLIGQTTANSPWTITTASLDDGEQTLSVISLDAVGNPSSAAEITLTIDTTAPAAPTALQLTAETDSGSSQTDGITKDKTPTIAGTAEEGTTVSIFFDEQFVETATGEAWQFSPTELADGELNVTATAKDIAGNISVPSAIFRLTVDTQAPQPPSNLRLVSASDTGQSSTDGITRETVPTYTADTEVGAFVRLFVDDELVASATNSPVLLTVSDPLTEGQHTAFATTEDLAGNLSGQTSSIVTVIDTTAPVAATVDLSATSDTDTPGDQTTSAGRVTLVGSAGAKSQVVLAAAGISALASQSGDFQLTGVPLEVGDNELTIETLDEAGNATPAQITITRVDVAASLDPVLRWNQAILDAVKRDASTPPQASRFLAMLHTAVFDAVSNIDGTPSYLVRLTPPSGASAEAAVSAAAHQVLKYAYPGQTSWFDAELTDALSGIPDGAAKTDGLAFGRSVADAVIQLRDQDGWDDFVDYVPTTNPSDWQPTAPMYDVALLPHWAQLEPFAMTSPSQFRPDDPPDLNSVEYATAVNELKDLGRNLGSTRTADQTAIARFWADGPGTITPPGHWNDIAQEIAADRQSSLAENARLFAILNVALADAGISAWNTKFHYNFWRPIDAIQRAGEDGNNQTAADESWEPLLITPPFPEYTSGHSTFSGAASQILTHVFGDNVDFTTKSPGFVQADGVTPVERSFTSFEQAANEAGRSRIYGGIHYEFSNQAGLASGRALGDFVWESFSSATDEQPPRVIILNLQNGAVASSNLTVSGRVFDNVSGVQSLEVSTDGGQFSAVQVGWDGSFTVVTTLATDGSADGLHRLQFRAADFRGNTVTTSDLAWTLDSRVPTISITETPEDGLLVGTANGTGSAISLLKYHIDAGDDVTIPLPNANGSFSISADLSRLIPGPHIVTVTAIDSAGLTHTEDEPFNLESRIAFRVTDHTPESHAEDIGSTYRPQVFFSRPVDTDTLTEDNFYATDSTGDRVSATVVPAQDGSFAWLFFTDPLPGASTITVHVEGNTIAANDDGAGLDADGDGVSGGSLTYSFSTVRLSPLPGTSLSGKVVDPGVDLKPMTFDDIRPGPDGVLHTSDDKFLLPIAGVKVFVLGLEDDFVLTDANGNFHFDSVPGGNVKLAVDGRTATNEPEGIYFPEMVMDLNIQVGAANTVMGTMGTLEEMLANLDRPEVYLPRLQTEILQTVSNSQDTLITVDGTAAPNLSDEQRQFLTLEVQPQSLIGPDGQPLANGQVGISTVPPELVREMLPPGLLQHTFDITIQAPAAATFSAPLTLTLPNVFNSPPGTKLNFLSFDHTTGRLVIEGTGTVSDDGLSVVTDAGTGITKPGWHGFTPPVTCGKSGGPPPVPRRDTFTVDEHEPNAIFLHDDLTHAGLVEIEFKAPKKKDPPPPPANGCPPREPTDKDDPPTEVTIEVQGSLNSFMNKTGDLPLSSTSFSLPAGSPSKKFKMDAKSLEEIFGEGGFQKLTRDQLYGSTIRVTKIDGPANARKKTIDTYVVYKWVDVIDVVEAKDKKGTTAVFLRTFADGTFMRSKSISTSVPTASPTTFEGTGGKPFEYLAAPRGVGVTRWFFQPTASDAGLNPVTDDVKIKVTVPFGNGTKEVTVNQSDPLKVSGLATGVTKVGVNLTGYKAHLTSVIKALRKATDGRIFYRFTDGNFIVVSDKFKAEFAGFMPDDRDPGEDGILRTDDDTWDGGDLDDRMQTEAEALFDAITLDYSGLSRAITIQRENAGADVTMQWRDKGFGLNGNADRYDYDVAQFRTYVGTQGRTDPQTNHKFELEVSEAAQQWFLTDKINDRKVNSGDFGVTNKIDYTSNITFAQNVANTVSHEIGHTFGLNESYITAQLPDGGGPFGTAACKRLVAGEAGGICLPYGDMMNNSRSTDLKREFKATTLGLLKAAVGLSPNGELRLTDELKLWRDNFNLHVGFKKVDGIDEQGAPAVNPEIVLAVDEIERYGTGSEVFELGAIAADGVGNAAITTRFVLTNWGVAPLTINSVALTNGNRGISLIDPQSVAGQVIDPQESVELVVSFDPGSIGQFEDTLQISSNAGISPDFSLLLKGIGQTANPVARVELVASNNLGGVRAVGGTNQVAELATITNDGVAPLILNQIRITDGAGRFSLVGIESLPDQLALGESFTFGVAFDPDHVGLELATIEILTNDPANPSTKIGVIGTGLDEVVFPQWGDDFVAMETPPGLDTAPLRVVSDAGGNFQLVIQPDQPYHVAIFDPITGLIAHGYGTTPQAGGSLDLTADLVFGASVAPDSDFDGLPDDIELAIGTSTRKADTDGDVLPDGVEIEQGWDPLDSRPIPLGVIAQMPLSGEANEVVLEGSFADAAGQTAYVATGSFGLGIVNTSKFYGPIALGQIDLAGAATDVSVDSRLQLAVVATNQGGVQIVDISDPRDPQLVSTLAPQSSQVEVLDGVAYLNVGTKLQSFDIINGVMIHELDLGGGNITAIARERSMLYTLDADNLLQAIDISWQTMVRRDSLALPVAGTKLFVANGVAYVGDSVSGGFATVDVSNANDFNLIAGPSNTAVVGTDVVATGSGQALSIGASGGVNKLQLLDVTSLSDTGQITDTFEDLPGTLRDVAVGGGFGYVAAGSAGLLTINFLGFDTEGEDPIVDVGTNVSDQDLDRPGVQVLEGTTVPLLVSISDDVQVRNVELLIDGQVVRNDVSFPFDFSAVALTDAANGQVRVQIRATDTGGNVGLSRELILEEVADTTDPTIISTSPNDGATRGQRFRTVQIEFSEPMDVSTLTAANLELRGPGDTVIAPIDIQIRNDDKFVQLTYSTLDAGSHQIIVKAASVRDRAGNALGANDVTSSFTVSEQAVSWINTLGGDWNDPQNWDQGVVPGPFDHVVIDVPENVTVTYSGGDSQIASLYSSNRFTLAGGRLSVIETVKVDNAFLIDGGTLQGGTVLAGVDGQGILFSADENNRLDGVTVNADLDLTREEAVVRIANGLTLHGTADIWGTLARVLIEGSQTITSGRFVLNTDQSNFLGLYGGIAAATAGVTLTLSTDVTVEGHGTFGVDDFFSIFGGQHYLFPFFKVINQGTIVSQDHGQPLTITAGEFQNEGSLKVRHAGMLLIDGMSGDVNSVEILHPDSELVLHGDGYVINDGLTVSDASSVTLAGEWTNEAGSTITVTNAEITLGTGEHLWSNLGTIDLTDSFVEIGGKMTRQSLDAVDRQGGELQFLGVLDNAGQTLALDTFASDWSSGRIRGGTIVAANSLPVQLPSNANGTQWKLEDVLIDADIVVPRGVTLQLEGNWENDQTITVDDGTLQLGGDFLAADLGDIDVVNGGSVEITGRYENTGATIHIDDSFDGWSLAGGSIHGGTVTFADPDVHRLFGTAAGGKLDGVTVQGDLELSDESASITIAGGTTFETAHLQGDQSRLLFAPNQTLTGTVLFEKGTCPQFFCSEERSVELLGPNPSLTIGPTGVIRTVEGFEGFARLNEADTFTAGGVVENLGAISVGPETNLNMNVAELRNNGSITVGREANLSMAGLTANVNDLSTADGTGSISLNGNDYTINQDFQASDLTLGGTWTNDAHITVDGGTTLSLNSFNSADPPRWHNPGSIEATNVNVFIGGTYFESDLDNITHGVGSTSIAGTLDNTNSTLAIDDLLEEWSSPFLFFQDKLTVRSGTVTAANNHWVMSPTDDVRLDGVMLQPDVTIPPGARLEMIGEWTNSGAIDVNGLLRLGGEMTTAGLGTIQNSTGTVALTGVLDNSGDNLTLNNATGVWTLGNATIQGGTLTVGDGSKLPVEGNAILDGVSVDGDLRIRDPIGVCCDRPALTLLNGTTFDTIHMDSFGGALRIGDNQTITGEVLMKGIGNQTISGTDPADTLTIAATGAIRTADGYGGFAIIGNSGFNPPFISVPSAKIINEGTIESKHPGNALLVNPVQMINHGTLRASEGGSLSVAALSGDVNTVEFGLGGGTIQLFGSEFNLNVPVDVPGQSQLSLQGHWTNSAGITSEDAILVLGGHTGAFGDIDATDSTVRLTGDFTLDDVATIQRTGGFFELAGALDNTGQSIALDTLANDWRFRGGEIVGGTVSTTINNFELPANSDLTLEDVEFTGTVTIPSGAKLTLLGDWINSGTIVVDGGDLVLGGTFDSSDLGDIQRDSGQTILAGTFDNRGGTLTLDNSTGSWRIEGGEIRGGTVNLQDGQTLIATSLDGALIGVDIHGDIVLAEQGAGLFLAGGTEFETAHLSGNSTSLSFGPNETITGNILFEGAPSGSRFVDGQGILTIDAASLIRSVTGFAGEVTIGDQYTWLINDGAILSEANNTAVRVNPRTLNSSGRMESSNGATLAIDAGNWVNTGILKTVNGTLDLAGSYATSSIDQLDRTGGTVFLGGWLNNIDATLALNSTTGSWNAVGAEIYGGTYTSANGETLTFDFNVSTLNSVTVNGSLNILDADVHVRNGLTLNDTLNLGGPSGIGRLGFAGSQTLDGTGTVVFGPNFDNALALINSDTMLTIGDEITVRGDTGHIGSDSQNVSNASVVNLGTIISELGAIYISSSEDAQHPKGGTFQNLGTIRVEGAFLSISNVLGSIGNIELPPAAFGSTVTLDGTDYLIDHPLTTRPFSQLYLQGHWTNAPGNSITVNDGGLTLGRETSWRNLGVISLNNADLRLSGVFRAEDMGTLNGEETGTTTLEGTFDNTNSTFAFNASTGSWNMRSGRIIGGTITQSGGAGLILQTNSSGLLDDVTLADDLLVQQGFELTIRNGLTLDSANLTLETVDDVCCETVVDFDGTQSVLGQGEIILNTNNFGNSGELNSIGDAPGLTFGPQVTVRGAGFIRGDGPITVQGTIIANLSNETLQIEGSPVTNEGTIRAENSAILEIIGLANEGDLEAVSGATLNLDGEWSNTGTITVTNADVNLGGEFQTSDPGSFDRNGGTVNLTGTLDNTGATLALDQTTGSWNLQGGTIHGGAYTAADGAKLVFTGFGGTLDSLTARGDLDLTQSGSAHVLHSLTLDNSSILLGNASGSTFGGLYFDDTSTLAGTGDVVFGKNFSNFLNTFNTTFDAPEAGTFTIGPDITIRGSSGFISDSFFAGRIVNEGKISADDSGGLTGFDYDRNFSGGAHSSTTTAVDITAVAGAASEEVYRTARGFGDFTYTFEGLAANTGFILRLHFAEIFGAEAGDRLFNVTVNGTPEFTDFDIVAEAGGNNKAVVEEIAVTSDADGKVIVGFTFGNNSPLVNGLELKSGATVLQTIDAGQLVGGTITINPLFVNDGEVEATNGEFLDIHQVVGNAGNMALVGTDSQLTLDGDNYVLNNDLSVGAGQFLNLVGTWSNAGTLEVNGGTLSLLGEFTIADLGALERSGGTVHLSGSLDNRGSTLALDASTGSWELVGGTILGGDYTSNDGARLIFTSFGGVLDGVTARGDLDLTQVPNANANIVNGLTLDNSSILLGNATGSTWGGLYFEGTSSLGGTGTVVFGKNSSNFLSTYNTDFNDPDARFTIGSDITVRGSSGIFSDGFFPAQIVNQGTISLDDSGGASSFDYDRNFTFGLPLNTTTVIETAGVTDPAPQLVYQTARTFGDFTYTIEGLTPSASHTLRLHFAEIFVPGLGERLFDVNVNGITELDDFDIVAEAGSKNKAVVKELAVTSDASGKITVEFIGSVSNPLLNGLELESGTTLLHAIDAGQISGGAITIFSRFSNEGLIDVSAGELLTLNNFSTPHTGTIHVEVAGAVNISGDFAQDPDGIVAVDVGGLLPGSFGTIAISGTATLDGDLQLAIVDGFVPAINDTLTPITFGSLSGQFADIATSGLPAGTAISETYNPTDLTLTVVAALRARVSYVAGSNPEHSRLTEDTLASVLSTAILQWCQATSAQACEQLADVQIVVANLGGDYLGLAAGNRIWIDDDAAGAGWSVDGADSPDRYDLLSVVMHEIGHLMGVPHSHDSQGGLMDEWLDPGTRRTISHEELEEIFGEDTNWTSE